MEDKFNIYVNGIKIPYPDTFDIEMQEISGSDDGRTLDATMDKNSQGFVYYLILDYEWLLSHRVARLSCIKKYPQKSILPKHLCTAQICVIAVG